MTDNINNSNSDEFINPVDNINYGLILRAFWYALNEHTSSPRESYGMAIIEKLVSHIFDAIFEPSNSKCAVEATRATKVMQTMMSLKTMMSWLAKKAKDDLDPDDYNYAISGALEGGFEIPGYDISVNPISTSPQNPKPDNNLKDFLNNIEKINGKKSEQIPVQDDLSDEKLAEFFEFVDGRDFQLCRAAIQSIDKLANQKIDPKENKLAFSLDLIGGIVKYYINMLIKDSSGNSAEEFLADLVDGISTITIMLEDALAMAKESLNEVSYNKLIDLCFYQYPYLISNIIGNIIDIPGYIVTITRQIHDADDTCSNCESSDITPAEGSRHGDDTKPNEESNGPGCGGHSCESCWDEVCKYCHSEPDTEPSTAEHDNTTDYQKILSEKWNNIKANSNVDNELPNVKVHVIGVEHDVKSVRENLLIRENKKLSKKLRKLKKKNKKLKKKLNSLYGK